MNGSKNPVANPEFPELLNWAKAGDLIDRLQNGTTTTSVGTYIAESF